MTGTDLRGLLRAARAAGAPLRRYPTSTSDMPEYWQCWDDGTNRRGALVRHWPGIGTWRVQIYSKTTAPDHTIHIDMQNPTITEIAAAARLCGWDVL